MQIAGVIANAQLHAQLERESREREVLAEIGRIIGSSLDLDEVYERFAEEVRKLLAFDRIVICSVDIERGMFTTAYEMGHDLPGKPRGEAMPLSGTHTESVIRTRSNFLLQAEDKDRLLGQFPTLSIAFEDGLRSFLTVPLISEDRVVGVLGVRSKTLNAYTDADVDLAERVGAQIVGAIVNAQLYEERMRAEDALRWAGEELELRVEERTAELREAHAQIVQQERLRALGAMAAGIAHDFNNELMGVLGLTELLLDNPDELDDRERLIGDLQDINTAARNAADVVRRLRGFYRPSEDTALQGLIDLRHLVEQVVSITQPKWQQQAQSRGADVKIETELREVPLISGNEAELREVLINLIFNAVDAIGSSGTINVRTYPEGEDYSALSVNDTGVGMTEEVRQRCMEPFFSTKGAEGSGLGLSLAYGVVQRHRGTIQIKSEIGRGTTVVIELPTKAGQQDEAIGTEVMAETGELRVLAVDDEPLPLRVVEAYLVADGHAVETATGGQEALTKLQAGEFDVVVTDRAMPGMNGDQLAAMINEANPDMPVILLTGFGDMMPARNEKVGNVAVVVGKPITAAMLREALAKAMEKGDAPV